MATKCPNKKSPEWIKLVDGVGNDMAWKVFLANNEETPEMSVIDQILAINKQGEPEPNQKEAFIKRMNSRIENGMYKEKSGRLVPITDSYNPETWWVEKKEDLVDFDHGSRNEHLFKFADVLDRVVELNKKYSDQGYKFKREQVVFPTGRDRSPNSKAIYRIVLTKPLIREIGGEETHHTQEDVKVALAETRELMSNAFTKLKDKTAAEVIDEVSNLEISDESKLLLDLFKNKLGDNPTLKIQVVPLGENPLEAANFDPTTNTISIYSTPHLNMKYPNLEEISKSLNHELLHAFTLRAFRNRYTDNEIDFANTIERLYGIAKKQTKNGEHLAYSNAEEWLAYVLTDSKIMREAMSMKLSVWDRILAAIKKLFGITSVYDHALKATIEYLGSQEEFTTDPQFTLQFKRTLEEDIYLNKDNLQHQEIWNKLNAFSAQFDFDPVKHTYTHIATGQQFYSVTEMLEKLRFTSGKLSDDPEVRARQLAARERGGNIGTVIHNLAEVNLKKVAKDIASSNDFGYDDKVITQIEHILRQFKRPGTTVLSEVLVADIDLKLAGTIDMIIIDPDNKVHIYDFKNKERGFKNYTIATKFGGSQLLSDKQRHAIQLSLYKDMFEKMTGLDVEDLRVVTLKPTINSDNIITSIELDKTNSDTGIVTVDYNYSAQTVRDVLKVSEGKSITDEFQTDKVDPETRKELDDKINNKIKGLTENLSELSAKEVIVNKSIAALQHKKDILYRTGKKYEIATQEKLIDDLLDEADVEKQLIMIVKYANKSSERILAEYNKYKKEGKKLPLTVLYTWRDSVSAFNALTSEEEGLKNLIIKEYGIKSGPAYKKMLDDTIDIINVVKSLYVTEGVDQLVDFLAPYYNKLYAELRLNKIKEYRRKKFIGEIKDNITESEYVDHAIDENEEDLQARTKTLLRKELKKAGRDIGVLTRWLDNLLDSTDPVTAAMVKAFAFADEEARLGTLEMRDDLVSLVRKMETWYRRNGSIPKSNEEFYKFMLETKNGELTGHYVTRYTSDMMREYRDIIMTSRNLDNQESRKAFINSWLDENMPLNKTEFKIAYWSFLEEQNSLGFVTDDEFNKLEQNQNYGNKLTIREMVEKGIIRFEAGDLIGDWLADHTWDFRMPVDKWLNPQWNSLEKILKDKNDPRGEFYNFIDRIRRQADSYLPFGFRLDTRLPGVIKQNEERIKSGQSVGQVIKGAISKELTFKIDDTSRIHEEIVDESHNAKYFLPIHFTGRITKDVIKTNAEGEEYTTKEFDPDEQSFDLATIYHKYWGMANDYNVKLQILPEMELAKFLINKRETIKRNAYGDAIFKKRLKGKGNNREEEEVTVNTSNLAAQVNDWFLTCVYGIEERSEGKIGKVDVGKLLNFINKYTSLNLLGLNVVAGVANVVLGETLERIESFAGEYMNPKDFLYADRFYLKTMRGMIGDIGARDTQGLGTHIVEYFGVFDDYGESDMDRRSKVGQLFSSNTLYATSHLGEHYMQSRFLFGMLSNKRAYNDKGEDIGRMLDQYELQNNKLVLNKEVNLVKSKWTDDDVLEFKSKMRGILSRMHGEYGELGKVAIQRMAIGRMAYLFRHFIIPGFRRRYGRKAYIERLGQFVEGNYITTGKFIGAIGGKIFGKNDENRELAFFQRFISNLQSFKLSMVGAEWASLTDHEKANVQRTLYEVAFVVLAILLANVVAGMKPDPDDDDADKRYWSFVMYQIYRMQNELLFFSPNLTSAMSILRSPMASMSVVENIIKLSGQIFNPGALYETGPWKGRPKILKTLNNMVPLEKQYFRLQDMAGQIPWMQKSGFGGKKKDQDEIDTTPTLTQ